MEEHKHDHKDHAHKHAAHYMEHDQVKKQHTYETVAWIVGVIAVVLAILFVASLTTKGFSGPATKTTTTTAGNALSADAVKAKTIAYVNSLMASQGQAQDAAVSTVSDQGDLYLMKLTLAGKTYDAYARKDGSLLFPSGLDMTQPVATAAAAAAPAATNVPKTDKPVVELFVMSYCPYGTQSEKGILPAVRALGSKIDFKLEFVDYSMHESFAPEVEENLRQYCIQKNQPDVYLKYLACFLNASNAQGLNTNTTYCQDATGVDKTSMNQCYTDTDKQYNIIAQKDDKSTWLSGQFPPFNIQKDLNTKYGVQGSPTLVINGVQSNAGRSASSYLAGICAAFNNAPAECSTQLDTTTPGPGFGYDSTSAATAAGCGV